MEPLKEWYNRAFYRHLTEVLASIYPRLEQQNFYHEATSDLDTLELKARMRRTTEVCRRFLPPDYRQALRILYEVAPRIEHKFVGIFLPDFVGLYGGEEFEFSLDALRYFTPFSSSEFAVREFLQRDLHRTLEVMQKWSQDENFHVRRLASEGSRPRLPWSFPLKAIIAQPQLTQPILENLKEDSELYVRKSVANHLNDISKDQAEWLLNWVSAWERSHSNTAWILRQGLRTLIKAGHPRALSLLGASESVALLVEPLRLEPERLKIGEALRLQTTFISQSTTTQNLVIDYRVHYVKKSGKTQPKVFKLKTLELAPQARLELSKTQRLENFTTRVHYPGIHKIEILVNGVVWTQAEFELLPA